jgi:hypothetical protein
MKRRAVLGGIGAALALGSAGCSILSEDESREFRLWFVRVLNGSTESEDVWLRVRRGSTAVYEGVFEDVPSFRDVDHPDQDPTFANEPNIRFVSGEWEPRSGSYEIEYRFDEDDPWETLELGSFSADDIGVDMQIMPGRYSIAAGAYVAQFASRDEVDRFYRSIENESQG